MVLRLKGQKVKITGPITPDNDISVQTTTVLHLHSLGGDTDKGNPAWVRTL